MLFCCIFKEDSKENARSKVILNDNGKYEDKHMNEYNEKDTL